MPVSVSSDASCCMTEVGFPHENNITAKKTVMLLSRNRPDLFRGSDSSRFIDPTSDSEGLAFGIVVEEDGFSCRVVL